MMANLHRFFGSRKGEPKSGPADVTRGGSTGQSYAATQRERELHRLILIEMERRGPEVTAEELYDELAARWDLEHPLDDATDASEAMHAGRATAPISDTAAEAPAWAQAIVAEQRETNRLLRDLTGRLERLERSDG